MLRYRTKWSKVSEEGIRANAPRVASFSLARLKGLDCRDMVVAKQNILVLVITGPGMWGQELPVRVAYLISTIYLSSSFCKTLNKTMRT